MNYGDGQHIWTLLTRLYAIGRKRLRTIFNFICCGSHVRILTFLASLNLFPFDFCTLLGTSRQLLFTLTFLRTFGLLLFYFCSLAFGFVAWLWTFFFDSRQIWIKASPFCQSSTSWNQHVCKRNFRVLTLFSLTWIIYLFLHILDLRLFMMKSLFLLLYWVYISTFFMLGWCRLSNIFSYRRGIIQMFISFYRSLSIWFSWWNYYWTDFLIIFALFLSSSFIFLFLFHFDFFWNPWLKTTLLILRWFIFQENLFLWQIILLLNILFLNN